MISTNLKVICLRQSFKLIFLICLVISIHKYIYIFKMDFGPNKAGFKVGLWNSNDKFDEN